MAEREFRQPQFEQRTVLGRDIRVARWRLASGSPGARPLLFFNGIGANAELIGPFAERLHGREIVTFDMPGVGGSPGGHGPYRPWMIAQVASELLTMLEIGRVDVMGVSWGGAIAQQFAFQASSRVERLVLAATTAGMVMVPGKLSTLIKMINPRRYADPDFMWRHFDALYGGSRIGLAGHQVRVRPPTSRGYLFQLLATAGWTSVGMLPFITAETLVMMGGDDRLVRPVNGRLLNFLIPRAELQVIEGAGHLFLVTHAKRIAELVTAFLDRESVGPAVATHGGKLMPVQHASRA